MNKILLSICMFLTLITECTPTPKETTINPSTYWNDKLDSLIIKKDRIQTEKALCEFVQLLNEQPEDSIKMCIQNLMNQCEKDPMFYMQMALAAEMVLYDSRSPLMNEAYYIPFLEAIQASECLNEGYKFRYEKQLEGCLKNRPGTQASNITFIDTDGKESSLYEIEAKHVLMVFYSPSCHKCQEVTNEMKQNERINQWIASEEVKVVAIYADGDPQEWENEKDHFPPTWINGFDYQDEIYKKETYLLRMTPSIYILDSEKKVILKDTNIEDITKYFLSLQSIKEK